MTNDGGIDYTDITHGPVEKSATLGALAKALALAQTEVKHAVAGNDNPFFKSKYADLEEVIDCAKGPLNKNGIAIYQAAISDVQGTPGICTMLLHESGEWLANTIFCKPKDMGPQAVGSVLSYLRRYSLAAAVAIAQTDDDAEGAQPGRKKGKTEGDEKVRKYAAKVVDAPLDGPPRKLADEEKGLLIDKARAIVGQDLHWDVKQSSAWLKHHAGTLRLAELTVDQLHGVIAKLEALKQMPGSPEEKAAS